MASDTFKLDAMNKKPKPVMINDEEDVVPNFAGTGETALATLKDRLDNSLKDDHTALEQLAKTLPLSEAAKKKYDKLSNRKLRQ